MRLDALLSRFGYCSRKEAPSWIRNKRVLVKGEPASSGSQKAQPENVLVDGLPVDFPNGLYIAINKPVGCTCSHDKGEGKLIYDYLPEQWLRRNPPVTTVGRLDKETSGLLLITDDGTFVHRQTSPKHKVPKVYEFSTEKNIPGNAIELFASGTLVLNGETTPCLPAILEPSSETSGILTIHEGRYHQVRRMLASVGAPVVSLKRIAIGNLMLDKLNLAEGEWTSISPEKID